VLSRFRPDSELSQVNARAGRWVQVSALLGRVLSAALAAARATDGWFDPTLGESLTRVGYDRPFSALVQAGSPASAPPPAVGGGWRRIRWDAGRGRLWLPPGVGLDFGGIAKGMAVDAALEALAAAGCRPALVSAGGDLAVRGQPPDGAWLVGVPGLSRPLALRRGAVATSGDGHRQWMQGPHRRHHLLDPRTGLPAPSDLATASVVAATCAQADVAATVAWLLGADRAPAALRAWGLAGILVERAPGRVQMVAFGEEAEEEEGVPCRGGLR
jgi:thiamine biosynthesis lipoprotein